MNRRSFLSLSTLAAATPAIARDFGPHAEPAGYPDPDLVALDSSFNKYLIGNTPIKRIHTGCLWLKVQRGTAPETTSSGATSPTTPKCATCLRTDMSARCASPTTAMATPLTLTVARSAQSTAPVGWPAMRWTARSQCWQTPSMESPSTLPMMSSSTPMAASGSPTPATAAWATMKATRVSSNSRPPCIALTPPARCKKSATTPSVPTALLHPRLQEALRRGHRLRQKHPRL